MGDYKLMRHLNSGEFKLFNVVTDYAEQSNLAEQMPEKATEMDQILRQYVYEVDGGTMSDVYAAYLEWLDKGLRKREERSQRDRELLRQTNSPDF